MTEFEPNQQTSPTDNQAGPSAGQSAANPPPTGNPPSPPPKKYVKRTAFYITATVIALLLLFAAFMDPLVRVFEYIFSLLTPLIIGAVLAYLCDPILKVYEYRVFRRMRRGNLRRGLSLFLTVLTAFGIVALVCVMMIPQLLASINELMVNYEVYVNSFLGWLQEFLDTVTEDLPVNIVDISDIEKLTEYLSEIFGSVEASYKAIFDNLEEIFADGNVVEKIWGILQGLFESLMNLILGIFIAFYILASKEKRVAQIRKFRKAMFSEKTDGKIQEIVTLTHKTFGGFIYGKILDSLVIGILTFVLLTIFEISPYNLLIATFVGITNIIPVFGPFIGAIPSAFVVLISNPENTILFLFLILIIQQIDGNIIGPKILGDNTGVSSLVVIIAISICSALWGVVGMIVGVPIFAVVIELVKRMLENKLRAKGEPTDTQEYYASNAVGNAEMDVHYEHSALLYSYERTKLGLRVRLFFRKLGRSMGTKSSRKSKGATDESSDHSEE